MFAFPRILGMFLLLLAGSAEAAAPVPSARVESVDRLMEALLLRIGGEEGAGIRARLGPPLRIRPVVGTAEVWIYPGLWIHRRDGRIDSIQIEDDRTEIPLEGGTVRAGDPAAVLIRLLGRPNEAWGPDYRSYRGSGERWIQFRLRPDGRIRSIQAVYRIL